VLRWLATDLDPDGGPAWHDRALRAVTHAAIRHRRIGSDMLDAGEE